MAGRSRQEFFEFLDYLGEKSLIPQNTATGRKAAATKVFTMLSDEEANDVTAIDIDDVLVRFQNKHRGKYTPESLQSYRSRLRNSLSEFAEYCENPLSFKPRRRLKIVKARLADQEKEQGRVEGKEAKRTVEVASAPSIQISP